jgi:hypothetical protein
LVYWVNKYLLEASPVSGKVVSEACWGLFDYLENRLRWAGCVIAIGALLK